MTLLILLTLWGCGTPCDPKFTDMLGDGVDQNCDAIDGTDQDGDGIASWQSGGTDCDDSDASKSTGVAGFQDIDEDGFGNPNLPLWLCDNAEDTYFSDNPDDCNDFNASIHPAHPEICDAVDNDCDGLIDSADELDDPTGQVPHFVDNDGDGYGGGAPFYACLNTPNTSLVGTDCDDSNSTIAPNKEDIDGDGVDQNCDNIDSDAYECTLTLCDYDASVYGARLSLVYIPIHAELDHTWWMGSPDTEIGRDGDETLHEVALTTDFWMMSTEVQQDLYEYLMGNNPSWLQEPSHPVETVSWHDAALFANALTDWHSQFIAPIDNCYTCEEDWCQPKENILTCSGYRLPTEAEWEYAARSGSQQSLWTPNGGGNIPDGKQGNGGCSEPWSLDDGTPITTLAWFCLNSFDGDIGHRSVAELTPNGFGLYDMHGNVWEWVHDDFGDYPTDTTTNPLFWNGGNSKVVRGGRWAFWAKAIRSAERGNYSSTNERNELGFRLVRSVLDN